MFNFPFNRLVVNIESDLFCRYDEMGNPPAPPGESFLVLEGAAPNDKFITENSENYVIE